MGNQKWLLRGHVCDSCQNYFGTEVENFILNKSILAWGRIFSRATTKKGKTPRIDMSLPKGGQFTYRGTKHTPLRGSVDADGTLRFELPKDAPDPDFKNGILNLHSSFAPLVCLRLAQFCLKAGLETLAVKNPDIAHDAVFDPARKYAREGSLSLRWPAFFRLTAKSPVHAKKELVYTLFPLANDAVWFEFEYVGVALRVNLLHPQRFRPAPGYAAIW